MHWVPGKGGQHEGRGYGREYATVCSSVDATISSSVPLPDCRFPENIPLAFPIKHHDTIDSLVGNRARTILHHQMMAI